MLLRRAKEGKLEAKCEYHYTDDYAYDAATDFGKTDWMPLNIVSRDENGKNIWKDNFINLLESDFQSPCGRAYSREDGTITFKVHSNLSYQVRIKG